MSKKLPRIVLALLLVTTLALTVYCALHGIEPISCDIGEDGASISIAGSEIVIDGSEIMDAYNEAEERAERLVPKKLRDALERFSELLNLS